MSERLTERPPGLVAYKCSTCVTRYYSMIPDAATTAILRCEKAYRPLPMTFGLKRVFLACTPEFFVATPHRSAILSFTRTGCRHRPLLPLRGLCRGAGRGSRTRVDEHRLEDALRACNECRVRTGRHAVARRSSQRRSRWLSAPHDVRQAAWLSLRWTAAGWPGCAV